MPIFALRWINNHSRQQPMHAPLFKIRENGKYGFIDAEGRMAIEPQYLEAEDFYNGFSRVRFNDKWVHIDAMGASCSNIFSISQDCSKKVLSTGATG
ncbi:MAG: WG repeat-containing protein [Lewinellaceae bacterium]|nr:WG repeat-containing protein [Lewinellaceae bacterium]